MELSCRRYWIAMYEPALSWRSRLDNRTATQLWKMPALDFSLEGVNGRRRRPSGDALSKPPWAARNVRECKAAPPLSGSLGADHPALSGQKRRFVTRIDLTESGHRQLD